MRKEEEEVVVVVVLTIFSPQLLHKDQFMNSCMFVGIVTHYRLNGRDQIPVGAKISAPIQSGCGTHPASYTRVLVLSRG
jgi:hypothetical protein